MKFKTKNNRLTAYALACGYVERWEQNDDNRLRLEAEHNVYHVKGFVRGKHLWQSFYTLNEARGFFDVAKQQCFV